MGCCFSKRSDPNEKDQADKSTKSLRMEITSPDDSQEKKVKKHLSQLPIQRTKKLSSSSSSPKTSSRSSSKTASIKGSYTFPPSNELNKDCLGKILKTPVGENFTTIKKLHLGLYGDILLVNDKRVSLKRVIKEVKKSEIQQKAHEKLNMKFQKFLCLVRIN
ncbi:unnamed protein product [Blepharisma stoltei]|uniref:Uncharacterized protein n=1 Tax=Blepharisma stoltei TaxID=1481888 RepID=A0AAU9ITL1_9CILI|nr:unnamed protein product [Blepharisma stoltei]